VIARFITLDLHGLLAQPMRLVVGLGFIVLFSTQITPVFAVPMAAAFTVVMVSTSFLADERGRLDILYGTLPISRTTVVLGRYASSVLVALVAVGLGDVIALIGLGLKGDAIDGGTFLLMNLVAVAILAVSLGVQLPVFFALGYTRARVAAMLPALIMLLAFTVAQSAGVLSSSGMADLWPRVSAAPVVLSVLTAAAALAVLIASALAARHVYRRRQF